MSSLDRNDRIAGVLYLTLLTAPLRLLDIPGKLFVAENASATANDLATSVTGILWPQYEHAVSNWLSR